LSALPLLVVPTHLMWRFTIYGAWLPNTYHAKVTEPWPQAGVRYLGCFVLEYAYWLWLPVALVAFVHLARSRRLAILSQLGSVVAVAACTLHVAYYVLFVGGDHFEWRVFSWLVIPLAIATLRMLDTLGLRAWAALAYFGIWWLASLSIPWTHWLHSRERWTRAQTSGMMIPVAPHFPGPLRSLALPFDAHQRWLIEHGVCVRHREHQVFYETMREICPTREEGARIAGEDFPVIVGGTVGVLGWTLPHVVILDTFGLNDYVAARADWNPALRFMAHEKKPPAAYIRAFRPNVELIMKPLDPAAAAAAGRVFDKEARLEVRPRDRPLTASEIGDIEAYWWKLADSGALGNKR
jgi:arabinofuranosyltransferase